MTSTTNTSYTSIAENERDPELRAVRQMMEEAPEIDAAQNGVSASREQGADRFPELIAPQLAAPEQATASLKNKFAYVARLLLARARRYRPESKRILWTSLVLMLLLQPFFVFGWSLAIIACVFALYYFMGADAFWRRVIDGYRRYHSRFPEIARQAKLRAYVVAKRWDRFLNRLPVAVSDQLRVPDLRHVMAADAAHEAAMSDRLTRIDHDLAAR